MTHPGKELTVACSYLLRLIKPHVELSLEQINVFKRTFHDVLTKRFVGHWFPATPHRGSAYRCLQTKHWKDPVLRLIAERSRLPLHRYLPVIFTIWIDPGEVAVCFGDEGTWCPLYKDDDDSQTHQTFSDGEDTASSLSSDDDLLSLTQNVKTLDIQDKHLLSTMPATQPLESHSASSLTNSSRGSSPFLNPKSTNFNHYSGSNLYNTHTMTNNRSEQQTAFWPQPSTMSDAFLSSN